MLTSKAFSDIVTFSRSSNATRIGPTGLVEYAPHNLLTYSEDFSNAAWTKGGTTITPNTVAAPDGTITADKLAEDSSTGNHWAYETVVNTNTTISVYAKAAERNFVALACAGQGLCYFNLSTGAVVSTAANCTASITSVGNGWYRCVVAATGTGSFGIVSVSADGTTVGYTGTTGSGIYIWGAQLSVGPYALDYTPTTSAAVYGPRFDYDPVTLAARGLLIEEQRSNLLTYSEQFDDASWTKSLATVTANAATAPDGVASADLIVPTSTSAQPKGVYKNVTGSASGTKYTLSIFAKASGKNFVMLGSDNTIGYLGWFNLSTGSVGTMASGYSGSIQIMGNGWYRCAITWDGAQGRDYPYFGPADADASAVTTINGSDGILIWGAQFESGAAFSTSYIPTVAASVTRSADVASVNTLSPWFNATTGTIYTEINRYADSVNVRGAVFNDGTTSNFIASSEYTFGGQGGIVVSGGVDQASLGAGSTSVGVKKKALAYGANDFALSENGGAVTTDTSGTVPTVTAMGIGCLTSANVGTGHIRRIAYYPRRLTNAELQALTA